MFVSYKYHRSLYLYSHSRAYLSSETTCVLLVKLSAHFLICCFIGVRRRYICHTFLAGTFDVSCPPIKSLLTKKPPKGGYNNGQELHLSHLQQGHCLLCYALLLPFSQIVRTRSIVFFSFVASCATSLFVSFSEWQYS